jgi:uncharacterized coiled-coil protein SlyX
VKNFVNWLTSNDNTGLAKLPWIIVICLFLACTYLFWHQVRAEHAQQQSIEALQTQLAAQAQLIHKLNIEVSDQANRMPTTINMKDLDYRFRTLQARIDDAKSTAQTTRIESSGAQSDLATRLSALEDARINKQPSPNDISALDGRLSSLEDQIAILKQLVSQ